MKVNVFYPKENFSGFDFSFKGKITESVYDEDGKFVEFVFHSPSIKHYEKVSAVEFQPETSNNEVFRSIITSHNVGSYPTKISDKIRSGELTTQHSSFSIGDVIQIEGCFYISNGYELSLLPLEFSNDN